MCVNCNNNACGGCQPVIPQGLPGVNGKNAYTFTTTSFTMPAVSSSVTLTVQSTGQFSNQWAIAGQIVYIDGAGYFTVVSKTGNNQITVNNLGYAGNATPGITISSNAGISPSGIQGIAGATGAAGSAGTTNLYSNSVVTTSASVSSLFTLDTYTIPSNTLSTFTSSLADGLYVTIGLYHGRNTIQLPPPITQDYVVFNYFGKTITQYLVGLGFVYITFRLTKASATSLNVNYSASGPAVFSLPGTGAPLYGGPVSINKIETAVDFTVPNTFSILGYQLASSVITLRGFYVDKIVA